MKSRQLRRILAGPLGKGSTCTFVSNIIQIHRLLLSVCLSTVDVKVVFEPVAAAVTGSSLIRLDVRESPANPINRQIPVSMNKSAGLCKSRFLLSEGTGNG